MAGISTPNTDATVLDLLRRVAVLETLSPAGVTPIPPTVPPVGTIAQFPGSGANTSAAFMTMLGDTSLDTIVMATGTYPNWNLNIKNNRSARPIKVMPAAGATVIWDGSGSGSGDGPFYFGNSYQGGTYRADSITFDSIGTGGIFVIQNYTISSTGCVWLQDAHNITMNGFRVRNIIGVTANGQQEHVVYVSTDGITAPTNLTFNDWDVDNTMAAGHKVSGLQVYHTPAPVAGLIARRWTIKGLHWGAVLRYAASGIDISDWVGSDCTISFDSQGPSGTVKRMHFASSGAPTINSPMVEGTGADQNYWAGGGGGGGGGVGGAPTNETTRTGTGNQTVTIPTPAVGSCLVAYIANQNNAVSTITGGGGTWLRLDRSLTHVPVEIWICPNNTGASTSVVVTFTANTGETLIDIAQWPGLITAPADQHGFTTSSSNGTSIGPTAIITPTNANQLIAVAAGVSAGGLYATGPNPGFTGLTRLVGSAIALFPGYQWQGVAAAVSAAWTTSVSTAWDTVIGSLKTA